jgi:hypothetical protein
MPERKTNMATKQDRPGKSSTTQQTAKGKGRAKQSPSADADGADLPIIVQGGGSIDVDMPVKFNANGTGPLGGKKFKNGLGDLTSMEVTNAGACTVDPATGTISITLNRTSRISISYA